MKAPPKIRDNCWSWIVPVTVLGLGIGIEISQQTWFKPFCGMREWIGVPCPFCGGTRSILAWIRLEWLESLHFNPLVFLACTMMALGFCLWTLERWMDLPQLQRLRKNSQAWLSNLILLTFLVFLNWLYLCWNFNF